jgi:hypothetical protein
VVAVNPRKRNRQSVCFVSSLLIENAGAVVTMNESREILYGVDILCDNGVVKWI